MYRNKVSHLSENVILKRWVEPPRAKMKRSLLYQSYVKELLLDSSSDRGSNVGCISGPEINVAR